MLSVACGPAPAPSPSPDSGALASPSPAEPSLAFRSGAREKSYTRTQLLSHPDKKMLSMIDQSGYEGRQMTYHAVPVSALVEGLELPPGSELHYQTRDGFSSSVESKLATNTDPQKSIAYIAVEPPDAPWPRFEGRDYTAGPFYLVWENPERSDIGREEWPFMLSSFTVEESLESRYPGLVPANKGGAEYLGYKAFMKNCFPCHTMDGQGTSKVGPDMNVPQNPTDYFTEPGLRQLIRDPSSVRTWPEQKMPAFDKTVLSEQQLDSLLLYMRSRKKKP